MAGALQVDLDDRSYPIHIRAGALDRAGELLGTPRGDGNCLVVSDERVAALHGEACRASLTAAGYAAELVSFPAGEASKTVDQAGRLWRVCGERRIDRNSLIVALGGGVTGDLVGFVAACWMRGVPLVQIPTTLLAMVDSAVGGKTAVNGPAGKNLIGAFKQPQAVIVDPLVVATMDDREYRAGLAEVLKYGVIRDAEFLAWQEAHAADLAGRAPAAVEEAVRRSCLAKVWYVARDEFEDGLRAHLNYGHTFGHALERETGFGHYLHGEAVGIGMRMAAHLGRELGLTVDADLARRQDDLLDAYGLPLFHRCADTVATAERLNEHARLDKKVRGGARRFVVPVRVGEVRIVAEPEEAAVLAACRSALQ